MKPTMSMPDATISAVFAGTFVVAYVVWKFVRNTHKQVTRRPPAMWSLPLIGSILFLPDFRTWHRVFLRMSAETGNVFALYIGSQYTVVLNGKETIHEALVKHSLDFSDRPAFYTDAAVFNIYRKGIINHQYDAELRRQHKLSLSILKEFGFGKDIMEERIKAEVSVLLQQVRNVKSAAFCPDTVVASCVLNVIVSILFGHHMDDKAVGELGKAVHSLMHGVFDILPIDMFPLLRFLPKMRHSLAFATGFHNQLFHIIRSSIETSDEDSFVRYYMNREGSNLDREQLEFIVRDFVIAGSETSTSTLQWALVLLAGRDGQCVQERMWKEIDSQVPRDRLPSLADRLHLPFVEATILEVMRIRTVVPLSLRHWTSRDTTVGGYFIPANTMVVPNLYSVHMDPKVWEDPEQFQPERFLDEFGQVTGKERIMPFSIAIHLTHNVTDVAVSGRRSCLGELLAQQEIYLFLAAIIQNFIIKPPDGCDNIVCGEKVAVAVAPEQFNVRFLPRF